MKGITIYILICGFISCQMVGSHEKDNFTSNKIDDISQTQLYRYMSDVQKMELNGSVKRIIEKEYNTVKKHNNFIKDDETEIYRTYSFNRYGNFESIKDYKRNNNLIRDAVTYYDSLGRKIKTVSSTNSTQKVSEKYSYPERDSVTVEKELFVNMFTDTIDGHETEYYDKKGRIIRSNTIGYTRSVVSYDSYYTYEDDFKLKNITLYEPNMDSSIKSFQNGLLQKAVSYETGKESFIREYEYLKYDKNGNWTKALHKLFFVSKGGESQYIIERDIEYYK